MSRKEALLQIESSIPFDLKITLKRSLNRSNPIFHQFFLELRRLILTNETVKNAIFDKIEIAIPYSGEILGYTFHDFWLKNKSADDIEECFSENLERQSVLF